MEKKYDGDTFDEFIEKFIFESNFDAVNLGCFESYLSDGTFSDKEEFDLFLHKFIVTLIERGGAVVYGGKGTGYDWVKTDDYGITPEEIADNIVREFHLNPMISDPGGVWFTFADKEYPKKVKIK